MNKVKNAVSVLLLLAGMVAGCRQVPEKRYDLKGKVVAVDRGQRQATIAHEKIPGFMDAMTMPFSVHDDWAITVLEPGQTVEATLVIRGDRSWIEGLRISKTGPADSTVNSQIPKMGDEVPDLTLVNQDGKRIHLHQFRGQPLLLTFIYTRCPLPDYCPRTSMNFSDVYNAIKSRPQTKGKPVLLTISFDTENDTPAVLREYAGRYMHPPEFKQWAFATGSADEIKKAAGFFGLSYWKESGQIVHSLVTALVGADGKIVRLYQGNQWKPADVLSLIHD